MRIRIFLSVLAILVLTLASCSKLKWEILFENKSSIPCDIVIALDASGTNLVQAKGLASGKTHSLIVGETKATVIHSIIVMRGTETPVEITPKFTLLEGRRYLITVNEDGTLKGELQ